MKLVYESAARREASEAAGYYDAQRAGLGDEFLDELDDTISAIVEAPFLVRELEPGIRRHRLKRFPYGIVYRTSNDVVYVIAVMHLHRQPGYWRDRL